MMKRPAGNWNVTISRVVALAICLTTVGCERTESTQPVTEIRMDADTAARSVDSLMTGGIEGPRAMVAEPAIAESSGRIPSGSLLDLSTRGNIDTGFAGMRRAIPEEPRPGTSGPGGVRRP